MSKKKTYSNNRRLLILSCSSKKRSNQGLLPALERYDGPAYRVINKFLRVRPSGIESLDIYVLSAEFGLIPASKPIPDYDRRMTPQRGKELQQPTLNELKRILSGEQYGELFISLGKDYLRVLLGFEALIPANLKVTVSTKSIGYKLGELRHWLYEEASGLSNNQSKIIQQGKAYIPGIEVEFAPEQVMEIAHTALAKEQRLPRLTRRKAPEEKMIV